uniref:Uncharacterized protein n=1 Tax=Oryza punctata TaxID=4537 RepID=A0A0E0LEU7_ORYPU
MALPPPPPPPAAALFLAAAGMYTLETKTDQKANGSKMSVESLLYMVATIVVAGLLLAGVTSLIRWCINKLKKKKKQKQKQSSPCFVSRQPAAMETVMAPPSGPHFTGPIYIVNVFNYYGGVGYGYGDGDGEYQAAQALSVASDAAAAWNYLTSS